MGLLDRFSGADWKAERKAEWKAEWKELESPAAGSLPPGWTYQMGEGECMGSAPASHWVYAACAETPDGVVAALANTGPGAYETLAARLRGEVASTPTWTLRQPSATAP